MYLNKHVQFSVNFTNRLFEKQMSDDKIEYHKLKLPQLKELCKEKGLHVSGTKTALIARLESGHNEDKPRKRTRGWIFPSKQESDTVETKKVDDKFKELGIDNIDKVSYCLKAGILNGFVKLSDKASLDEKIFTGECEGCSGKLSASVRDILYQADYGGNGTYLITSHKNFLVYEEEGGPIKCPHCEDGFGHFVTDICCGDAHFDSGKFHNHCKDCPNFGYCIGDYREQHCLGCGQHYHGCGGYFPCPNCGDNKAPRKMKQPLPANKRRKPKTFMTRVVQIKRELQKKKVNK